MSCCPPGSWPALETQRETYAGSVTDLGDGLQAYVVLPPPSSSSSAGNSSTTTPTGGIISFQDIYAYDSARAWSVADQLAVLTGCVVVHVDFTQDAPFSPATSMDLKTWVRERPYDTFIRPKLVRTVIPYLQKQLGVNAQKLAAVGFCWGSYLALQATCADPEMPILAAAVHFHPSLKLHGFFDETDPECNNIARGVVDKTPQLLIAAGNDPDFVGPEGSVIKILQAKCAASKAVVLKDQVHGFVNRGDVNDDTVKEGVKKAIELATGFLKEHLEKA